MLTSGKRTIICYLTQKKKFELIRHGQNQELKENIYPKPSGTEVVEEKSVVTDLGVRQISVIMSTRFAAKQAKIWAGF